MEKKFTEKESLELITKMINNSKRNVSENAGGPSLIWGYATVVTSLLVYLGCLFFYSPQIMYLWCLLPIIGGVGMLILNKREKPVLVKTYFDRVINAIWIVFGVLGFSISISAFIFPIPILFIIAIVMTAGTTLTGLVSDFKPYVIMGFIGMALSFLCLAFTGVESILIFAGIFVVAMIIPGHMANSATRSELKARPETAK